MKLQEIADRIYAHLKRFEADRKINKTDTKYKTSPYYCVNAFRSGSRICVSYVTYQGGTMMKKAEALEYLAWLDAGNVGTHYDMRHRSGVE